MNAPFDPTFMVNEKFAAALLEEMEGSADPVVFVQDYHFALLPRLVKAARPDARVAIFWHIPWPNPEAFGICPLTCPSLRNRSAFSAAEPSSIDLLKT